ncbi:MAG: carbon storage regulator [Calditrichaeota bacterium]|nr:MAG: carbon storage regulator [Calditrichota bacterium]
MLVLTRKLGQDILIGDQVLIKVVKIENNKVQLGIQAPRDVAIFRYELIRKIKDFNYRASTTSPLQLKNAAGVMKQIMQG